MLGHSRFDIQAIEPLQGRLVSDWVQAVSVRLGQRFPLFVAISSFSSSAAVGRNLLDISYFSQVNWKFSFVHHGSYCISRSVISLLIFHIRSICKPALSTGGSYKSFLCYVQYTPVYFILFCSFLFFFFIAGGRQPIKLISHFPNSSCLQLKKHSFDMSFKNAKAAKHSEHNVQNRNKCGQQDPNCTPFAQ